MKSVKLLLANSDRRSSNLIEVVVRDVCFERAVVECTRTSRIDEFLFLGTREQFDLIVVAPDHLMPEPSRRTAQVSLDEALRGIRRIKRQSSAPLIAVCVPQGYEPVLIEAGAAATLGLFFRSEAIEAEVRRVLTLPEQVEVAPQVRWSLAGALLRGLQRLSTQ